MIITCPNCSTQFAVEEGSFGTSERKVRCSACHYIWVQPSPFTPPPPPPPPPPPMDTHVPMPEQPEDDLPLPIPSALLDQARFEAEMAEAMAAEGKDEFGRTEEEASAQRMAEALADPELTKQDRLLEERRKRLGASRSSASNTAAKANRSAMIKKVAMILGWVSLLGFVVAVPSFVWKERALMVQMLPAMALVYEKLGAPVEGVEVIGLELRELHSSFVTEEGNSMLVVSGEVANVTSVERVVPPLRVALKDAAGKEMAAFTVTLPGHETLPGESRFVFNAKLPTPGDGARDIEVAFMGGHSKASEGGEPKSGEAKPESGGEGDAGKKAEEAEKNQ